MRSVFILLLSLKAEMTRRCHFTGLLKSLIMNTLIGSLNSNSAGFRSEVCLSESPDIHFPVYWQFLSPPKSHTCFYHSFMVSIVKFPGAAWLRLISPCLYRDSVFNTASFSVATYTGITFFLVSVISMYKVFIYPPRSCPFSFQFIPHQVQT